MQAPWLTIIVPVRLRSEEDEMHLSTLLQSLARVDGLRQEARVLVVDNHPVPHQGLRKLLSEFGDWSIDFLHESRPGAAQARNTGAHHAGTPWIAFVDADEALPPHWLAKYRQALEAHAWRPEVVFFGAIRPRLVISPKWLSPYLIWLFGGVEEGENTEAQRPLRQIFSGNMLIYRQVFLKVGGFLSLLPRGEDTELGLRLECLGNYKGVFLPEAFVWHHLSASRLKLKALGLLQQRMEYFKTLLLLYHFYSQPTLRARLSLWRRRVRRWGRKFRITWQAPTMTLGQRLAASFVWSHGALGTTKALFWEYRHWLPLLFAQKYFRCVDKYPQ